MKSVMSHDFSRIPRTEIQVSTFDRSHGVKTAFDEGLLVPIYLDEVVPGDTFSVDASLLTKMLSPLVSSPMDNIFLDTMWFYVPSRLLWNNFTRMMGERPNPNDSIDFLVPQIDAGANGFAVGSLADYFGIPTDVPNLKVNALPFRAYAKIWDDWFRCEYLQQCIIQEYSDLDDNPTRTIDWNKLLYRGKRHDYFTACLPWPQLGEGVELPLGAYAAVRPLYRDGSPVPLVLSDGSDTMALGAFAPAGAGWRVSPAFANVKSMSLPSKQGQTVVDPTGSSLDKGKALSYSSGLVCDLSSASAATINSLRMAFQLQRMMEKDARGGTRYVEIIRQHFNTICPDARLQRSEYLGGSSDIINLHTMYQQSATDSTSPQGNRIAAADGFAKVSWTKSFTEHGYIIGLVNVRADINYQQGLNRLWSRRGRYDFYWPTLAHLGEQAVLNKEIFAQGTAEDDKPFGYQERYAEYRYHPSIITGKLRSKAKGTLDVWHLAQMFNALPTLSPEFIEDHPPISRVLAVQTGEPHFLLDAYIGCKCTRPMPMYSVPGLIDHL